MRETLEKIRGGLVVSCQAQPDEPLHGAMYMAKMALAAKMGGAVAVRGNGPPDISAMKAEMDLPVIGIYKRHKGGTDVIITPDFESAAAVIGAGADIVALDCTRRQNHLGTTGIQVMQEVKKRFEVPVMAEISVLEEAVAAFEAGADIISTTLSGYTPYSPQQEPPDFALIADIRRRLPAAYINGEGRFLNADHLRRAFELGADIVTIGGAITRPQLITRQLVDALKTKG